LEIFPVKYLFRLTGLCAALICLSSVWAVAQTPTPTATPTPDPFVVQITSAVAAAAPSPSPSATPAGPGDVSAYIGDISGNGRFVVFESKGDLATIAPGATTRSPGNADGNREIFIWDAAQRRIFQITNTQSALVDNTKSPFDDTNIAVEVSNNRPEISRDGHWLVFSSNAPTPGDYNGTVAANKTALQADGNQEIFLYHLPDAPDASLTSGTDPVYFDLRNTGNFTRVTDTPASLLPKPGALRAGADDNRYATINDTGSRVVFVSTRTFTTTNGRTNTDGNPEIFVYNRLTNAFTQITTTSGTVGGASVFNDTPSISGGTSDDVVGESQTSTIAFYSNASSLPDNNNNNAAADNADGNAEIFIATYDGAQPTTIRQVTRTKLGTNPAQIISVLNYGRRVSRNGNFVVFDSLAADPSANTTTTALSPFTFVYNLAANSFVAVVPPASDAEANANTNDRSRLATFTGDSARIVFSSTLNLKADGTRVDQADASGLNPNRNTQLFAVNVPASSSTPLAVTRLSNFPGDTPLQFAVSNTVERIAFSSPVELGGGNSDGSAEAFYQVLPPAPSLSNTDATASALAYFTGASRREIATATASPTPTPSPTPATTPLTGLASGMIAIVDTTAQSGGVTFAPSTQMLGCPSLSENCEAASESFRRPPLPFELNGVSLSIANAAAGLYFVSPTEIVFEVPRALAATTTTPDAVVINIRTASGVRTVRSLVHIAAAQPDLFSTTNGPGGQPRSFNATNPSAPIAATSFSITSPDMTGTQVATVVRVILTGAPRGAATSQFTVRLTKVSDNSTTDIPSTEVIRFMPLDTAGFELLDFRLPATLAGAGDVAVTVIISSGGQSRAADTAPRIHIN
jgi:uncharacterized protein (TIGR03437 family)